MYIFLESGCKDVYKNNNFIDFNVSLPSNIVLEGNWELGLAEIYSKASIPDLYVCCDIVSSSYLCEISEQVLRFLPSTNDKSLYYCFDNIFYFDIIPSTIKTIRMYIKKNSQETSSFANETLYCTLHIRQKK